LRGHKNKIRGVATKIMVENILLKRCTRKLELIQLLIGAGLMEVYNVVVDSMEASDYQAGKALYFSKHKTEAAIAFKSSPDVVRGQTSVKTLRDLQH
jgi:hypothetical protein